MKFAVSAVVVLTLLNPLVSRVNADWIEHSAAVQTPYDVRVIRINP
jgi:hypothetical protein